MIPGNRSYAYEDNTNNGLRSLVPDILEEIPTLCRFHTGKGSLSH